jgi:hypothetical protein
MNLKNSILVIASLIAGIVGTFLNQTQIPGGLFVRGLGIGFPIVLSFNVIPKLI